jgi:hypothetical protein
MFCMGQCLCTSFILGSESEGWGNFVLGLERVGHKKNQSALLRLLLSLCLCSLVIGNWNIASSKQGERGETFLCSLSQINYCLLIP